MEAIARAGVWIGKRARHTLQKRGVWGTFMWGFGQMYEIPARHLRRRRAHRRELEFDRAHNVDTAGVIAPVLLGEPPSISEHAYAYQGCDPDSVRAALRRLPIKHSDFALVDLGSGKGRVLMAAREFNFRKLVGVEFSRRLCEIAERNNGNLRAIDPSYPTWEIICGDAAVYVPQGQSVVCLYNPFGPMVMKRVLANISRPSTYVLYFNPKHSEMFESDKRFRNLYRDSEMAIYATIPD